MSRHPFFRSLRWPLLMITVLALVSLACALGGGPYHEEFDSLGTWGSDDTTEALGHVTGGVFEFTIKVPDQFFWSTGGENFGDGTYEVEATQIAGPVDNGYGMMFRIDNETDSFYLFEVSGDGFVLIARCGSACEDYQVLVEDSWFTSPAVNQGTNNTNLLKVEASGSNMTFFVNGQSVGTVTDATLAAGDIGVFVETFSEGGVTVHFDNFKFTPPADE
ncbi:MAG: hypothetical protein IPL78_08935 [Chloroflexi bacterium]|nr:hypothetical protein [Chloroflexota bacterium]